LEPIRILSEESLIKPQRQKQRCPALQKVCCCTPKACASGRMPPLASLAMPLLPGGPLKFCQVNCLINTGAARNFDWEESKMKKSCDVSFGNVVSMTSLK